MMTDNIVVLHTDTPSVDVLGAWTLAKYKEKATLLRDINATLSNHHLLAITLVWDKTPQGKVYWGEIFARGHTKESIKWIQLCRAELISMYPNLMNGEM